MSPHTHRVGRDVESQGSCLAELEDVMREAGYTVLVVPTAQAQLDFSADLAGRGKRATSRTVLLFESLCVYVGGCACVCVCVTRPSCPQEPKKAEMVKLSPERLVNPSNVTQPD